LPASFSPALLSPAASFRFREAALSGFLFSVDAEAPPLAFFHIANIAAGH
jgi:hypothetical protein